MSPVNKDSGSKTKTEGDEGDHQLWLKSGSHRKCVVKAQVCGRLGRAIESNAEWCSRGLFENAVVRKIVLQVVGNQTQFDIYQTEMATLI